MSLFIFGYVLPFIVFWVMALLCQDWSKPVEFQVKDVGMLLLSLAPFLNVALAVVSIVWLLDEKGHKVLFTFNKRKDS